MDTQFLVSLAIILCTFALYIWIAVYNTAKQTSDFYVAGRGIPPIFNGMAIGADWMSAASFIGMAGTIMLLGYDGLAYIMGWTGGYLFLTILLAPQLRKFGRYTVPEFIGDRFNSKSALVKKGVGLDSQKCRYVGEMSNPVINYPMLCSVVFWRTQQLS